MDHEQLQTLHKSGEISLAKLNSKVIKDWRYSWNESEELNNSESSKPSIIDEANVFCAIEEFDDSFKSSGQGDLSKGIDNKTVGR